MVNPMALPFELRLLLAPKPAFQPNVSAIMLSYQPRASFASLPRYSGAAPNGLVPLEAPIATPLPSLT